MLPFNHAGCLWVNGPCNGGPPVQKNEDMTSKDPMRHPLQGILQLVGAALLFSVMSLMGMIALSGVVVNDSLVLISYANKQRDAGMSLPEAIHSAGVRRFRPILLTTLTTFGGLAPMIFETSRQARFMIPMALSLGFGILFATFISLLIVPCLYLVVEDVKRAMGVGSEDGEAVAAPQA